MANVPRMKPTFGLRSSVPPALTMPKHIGNFPNGTPESLVPSAEGEMSPRGKHKYPAWKPWTCECIIPWLALVMAFVALVLVGVIFFRGRPGDHDNDNNWDKRAVVISDPPPGVNYRVFRLEAASPPPSIVRWPEAPSFLDAVDMPTLVRTELCCLVGNAEYFVCDSGRGLATNMGLAYVLRRETQDRGPHLLITVASKDMQGAQCVFSWEQQAPAPTTPEIEPPPSTQSGGKPLHQHGRHARD